LRARAAAAPGNYISQISYGAALVKDGDTPAAKPVLERAAQLAPQARGDSSPHGLLAQIAIKQGDTTQARKELRALLAFDHANIDAARKLAALAATAGATDDQDFALRLVADLNPFDADTHGLLGRRELARGNRDAALVEFQVAVALGPVNPAEAHADVAEVLLSLERKDEAKREALLALMEAPTYARAQDLLLKAIGRQ
jgi:Flp pilus assembly protein TadD